MRRATRTRRWCWRCAHLPEIERATRSRCLDSFVASYLALPSKHRLYYSLLTLQEVAGSYGGGCVNITDRFLSGFSYLSTIGTVAASGFGRMHRQDLAGELQRLRL